MTAPAMPSASAGSRAIQPSRLPTSSSAATIAAPPKPISGTAGTKGATAGSSSTVIARVSPARTMAGGSASPKPGSSMTAMPVRDSTRAKANAQPGNAASSAASSTAHSPGDEGGHWPPTVIRRSISTWV